jgi:hypothetical protein
LLLARPPEENAPLLPATSPANLFVSKLAPPKLRRGGQDTASLFENAPTHQDLCCLALTKTCTSFLSVKSLASFTASLINCALLAHTVRKGFSALISGIRKMCGGPALSLLSAQQRTIVRPTLWLLGDAQRSMNKMSTTRINEFEGKMLLAKTRQSISSKDQLKKLYFLGWVEYFGLLRCVTGDQTISFAQAKVLTGFCYFFCLLAAPVARAGLLANLKLDQFIELNKNQTGNLQLVVAQHKTGMRV